MSDGLAGCVTPEWTTMRVPKDVNRMVVTLASIDGLSVLEFNDTIYRDWLTALYHRRLTEESQASAPHAGMAAHDLGGEG